MSSESDAGKDQPDAAQRGSSLHVVDEEQVVNVAPEKKKVQFPPPQDVTSKMITFTGADGDQRDVSVEGIVEYGADAAGSGTTTSTRVERRAAPRIGMASRRSSLDSRKEIPDSLLLDHNAIIDDVSGSGAQDAHRGSYIGTELQGCFHRFFVNPSFPLRRQMLLTFGSVSSLTILLVMAVSIIASITTGDAIKKESNTIVEQWVDKFTITTSQLIAEALSPKITVSALCCNLGEH